MVLERRALAPVRKDLAILLTRVPASAARSATRGAAVVKVKAKVVTRAATLRTAMKYAQETAATPQLLDLHPARKEAALERKAPARKDLAILLTHVPVSAAWSVTREATVVKAKAKDVARTATL